MNPLLRSLSYSLCFTFLFLSCKKKEDPFMDVGKYEVIKYSVYPNGDKDTLEMIAYGPRFQSSEYYFDIKNGEQDHPIWSINKDVERISLDGIVDGIDHYGAFLIENFTKTESSMEITYSPNYGTTIIVSDSSSGRITFNRIPL